jgi:hypothetical protein
MRKKRGLIIDTAIIGSITVGAVLFFLLTRIAGGIINFLTLKFLRNWFGKG